MSAVTLDDLLSPQGPVARGLPRYERRPEQEQMAQAVDKALRSQRHLLAEAGTGVGKSFAYLVPAILRAIAEPTKGPVIVSTRTIALQEQLLRKDLPFLQRVLPVEFKSVVAMGRSNYLCQRRMRRALADRHTLFADLDHQGELERIAEWSATTKEGTRQDLPFAPRPQVWEEVQAESGNCLHQKCPHFAHCHYQWGRRRMGTAQILVVNHALYFADLALRQAGTSYLPDHAAVVFDEAHHLERIATEALSHDISPGTIEWHLSRLLSRDGRRGLLSTVDDRGVWEAIGEARARAQGFFAQLEGWLAAGHGGARTFAAGDRLEQDLSAALHDLSSRIGRAAENLPSIDLRMELKARAGRVAGLAIVLDALTSEGMTGVVRWVEWSRKSAVLRGAPLSVREEIKRLLLARVPSCILVSATLGAGAADPEFLWLRERLGIEQADTLRVGSPFKLGEKVVVRVEDDLPDPAADADAFERESIERIGRLCKENRGRALVLCTSWKFVERCHAELSDELASAGITMLKQGTIALSRLVERKREDPDTVLIGADALWEGIDLPGPTLDLVIICRLPFLVPSHPLTQARAKAIQDEGGSPFNQMFLPEAVVRFRQGFGRLIRTMDDRGTVVVLDPRVRTKRYGRAFAVEGVRMVYRSADAGEGGGETAAGE